MMPYIVYINPPAYIIPSPLRCAGCCIVAENKVLLIQRGQAHDAAGTWEIPGGKIEPHEASKDAAIREVKEEVGIDVDTALISVGIIHIAETTQPEKIICEYHVYAVELPAMQEICLESSHTTYGWFTLQEALQLPLIVGTQEIFQLAGFIAID